MLREIWRVLKDHGRAVIADTVSDRDVPPKMRADGQLRGECISGVLIEDAFHSALERAGSMGSRSFASCFGGRSKGPGSSSVTVRGYKFEKKAGCRYVGQYAVYLGLQKAVINEEGHLFPRGPPVKCARTRHRSCRILRTLVRLCSSTVRPGHATSSPLMTQGAGRLLLERAVPGPG